ncbi:MAG: preprotein translocase subunit SecA [Candidatus Dasytiphilus stammeri]
MLLHILKKIFGSRNDRMIFRLNKLVLSINNLEKQYSHFSDKSLKDNTRLFRQRLQQGENLDNLLPEAFATVREASKRVFNMRHFDVQLLGGIVLNSRCIAEMRTGEGKTLTATLPAYLNALPEKGVHIVTVNDYLAQRDANINRPLFEFLGMTIGLNLPGMTISEKKTAYLADITYGTNNEYGFDYLRDNMAFSTQNQVQRPLYYALVDEVDSILIDEARTPLIISGSVENNRSEIYIKVNNFISSFIQQDKEDSDYYQGQGHFCVDEKNRQVYLTERGLILIEELLVTEGLIKKEDSLYSPSNIMLMQDVTAALRARTLFIRNRDYLIKNEEIVIVDEHTGRTMPGRRWSEGLHQAIEAKERVKITNENQTLASITFQNYFLLYNKLSGMTGTAETESFEFSSIYQLDTIVIPTHKIMIRQDLPDLVYFTEQEKIFAIISDIKSRISQGQPVLVGTISIEKSEKFSQAFKKAGIIHNILNAKFHDHEAEIIAQAGQPGAVTIATNMAGRGTDIVLGGNLQSEILKFKYPHSNKINSIKQAWKERHKKVVKSGGLHIIGTERHESRRIDNQLRGRSGRQGDPGSSRFYLSMEDNLMRIFASDRLVEIMKKLGIQSTESIEHPWVTQAIAHAQCKVEGRNFDLRKQLLEYDNVANDQRRVIYSQRNEVLVTSKINLMIDHIFEDIFQSIIQKYLPSQYYNKYWNITTLEYLLKKDFQIDLPVSQWCKYNEKIMSSQISKKIIFYAKKIYNNKKLIVSLATICQLEKNIILKTLDALWQEHLAAMDYLRQGIHLRGYAQKDPQQEYKRESFEMFSNLIETMNYEIVSILCKMKLNNLENFSENTSLNFLSYSSSEQSNNISSILKIGRNQLCPCGSQKKYKRCHGQRFDLSK